MKKFNYIAFVLIFITALIVRINAATTSYNDIPNNSYVIGTHLYTNEVPLTIKHIMLASNTIEGNTLSDMKLYYKTSRGKWIDGLTGEEKTHLSSYTINYRNSETTSTYYENANTSEMNKNDIPNNSYVIGSHLYTSEMPLTTNHIMLASRTISENRLSYMRIYYKTSRGKWIDGVSGEEVTVSNSINISHINLEQVTKQTGYITLNETKKTITYGTNTVTFNVVSSHGGTISVVDNNSTSTITKDGNTITVSNLRTIDAGTTITVTVRSAETNAYTEASTTYLITINKADSICPTVTEYSGTYDAKEHTVTVSGGSGGTIKYEKSTNGGTTYTDQGTTNPVRVSAGTTYIRVRIEGDSNHNDKTCDTETITISKKTVTIKASNQSKEYDGTALKADSTCEITSGGIVNGHTLLCTNTGSQTEVGSSTKTLSIVQVMRGSSDVSDNYKITKANGTLTVTNMRAIYDNGLINNNYFNIIKNGDSSSGIQNTIGINMAIEYAKNNNITNIKLEEGTYYVSPYYENTVSGSTTKYAIKMLSDINFDLNKSNILLTTNSLPAYHIILFYDISNSNIYNGTIKGDRETHTCENGDLLDEVKKCEGEAKRTHEYGHVFNINTANNIIIDNIDFGYATGDGVVIIDSENITITNSNIHYVRRNGISLISGKYINITNNSIHDIIGTSPQTGIDIEKNTNSQKYSNVIIDNNQIYNVVSNNNIQIWGMITDLDITNNSLSKRLYARVKQRKSLDTDTVTNFPTDVDAAYLMEHYNINISNNRLIDANSIDPEHGNYVITATEESVNELFYNAYIAITSIKCSESYDLNVGDTQTISVTLYPSSPTPTYKVLGFESNNLDVAKVNSSGKITALKEGVATITVTATDYGKYPNTDEDDVIFTKTITVNVSNEKKLYIQYNGNGGTWNEDNIPDDKKLYIDNQSDGMVRLRSTNDIYVDSYDIDDQNINLIDYNGEYLNWRKSNAGVPPESEYYVLNESTNVKTYLNQMNNYSAVDIAAAAGCNLSNNSCTIIVYVNWEQYLITDNDFLKTSGTKFVKAGTDTGIVLRGYNIGEWLSRAISLSPMENAHAAFDTSNFPSPYTNLSSAYWREYADNDIQINYILYKRFGKDGEYNLNNIYYKNFITESDIEKMQEIGINAVRVPLAWSYFVDMTYIEPSAPITITSSTKPSDMNAYKYSYTMLTGDRLNQKLEYLDWIVHECRKRGIYVIFDLHVVDGGQSDYGIRPARGFTFYDDQNAQNNAIDIWKIVARRFNGNPGVAGYELLNEPFSGIGGDGNKYIDRPTDRNMYRDELIRFYDMTYKAIRDIDPNHVIIMEAPYLDSKSHQVYMEDSNGNPLLTLPTESERTNGITDTSICPATQCKWTNVAYSLHDYFFWSNSVNIIKNDVQSKVAADVRDMKKYNVPIYIGETNFTYTGDNEELDEEVINSSWNYALMQYDNNLFSYTLWSYKVAKSFRFGMVYNLRWNYKNQSMALLLTDDYDTIANKWSMNETDAHYDYVTTYVNILKNNFINNSDKPIINNSTYTCTSDQELISSIKVFSRDGSVTIDNVKTNNSSIADVSFIDPTGVICTSSSCKTIKITCKTSGTVTLTATASNGATGTSTITVSNN